MNGISASEKLGDFEISVTRSLSGTGILIYKRIKSFSDVNMSGLSISLGDWLAMISIIDRIRQEIEPHHLTSEEQK